MRAIRLDLGLSKTQMGWVLGSFFWGYALLQIPSGWIGDRFGSRGPLTVFSAVWSLATGAMALAGGYFGYRMVFPQALEFLIGYGKQFQPMITIGEYTDLFLTVILGLGVVFELPILVFFLALMGVVSAGWMWRNVRYSILVIFIVAAILTPTTDILNMCIFAAPMIGLYFLSIGIAWFVHPKQRKAREAKRGG